MQVYQTSNGRGIYKTHASNCVVRLLLTTALCCASGLISVVANAQETQSLAVPRSGSASETKSFSFAIPAQSMDGALAAFSRITHLQTIAAGELTRNVRSPGVSGTMTTDVALTSLLTDTGLAARISGNTVIVRKASSAITLGPIRVLGHLSPELGGNLRGPISDSVARRLNPPTTIGSKDAVSLREIPQSVTVITQDEIQTRNMLTVDDVIQATPGMTVAVVNQNDTMYSARGFPLTAIQLDGVPTVIPAGGVGLAPDSLAMYDRVEILRGPAGLFNGFGGDGGVINLVRKRAPDNFQLSGLLSAGTYDNVRGLLDVGSPLNKSGTIRFRAVGFEQYQHEMQDTTWQHDQQFYSTLEADLAPGLTARAGVSYTDTDGRLMYGVPYVSSDYSFPHFSRSAYMGAPWNHYRNKRLGEFLELSQVFKNGWLAKLSYNHYDIKTDYLNGIVNLIDDQSTNTGEAYNYKYNQSEKQHALDFYLSGPFSLLGRKHRITIGANYMNQHTYYDEPLCNMNGGYDEYCDVSNVNIYDNSIFAPLSTFDNGPHSIGTINTQQVGLYGNLRLSITKRLTLLGGGRATWWHSRQMVPDDPNLNYWGSSNSNARLGPKFSPFAGVIYDISKNISAYASYTSIYKPQSGDYTVSGDLIRPIEGEQYEVGLKSEHFDGRLTASIALFRTTETNNAVQDPQHTSFYLSSGMVQSQGVEIQAHGQLAPGWTMLVGYTYDDLQRGKSNSSNDYSVGITPKHLFKLSTDYILPGRLKHWTVGASIYAQTKTYYYCCSTVYIHAPGYAIADARISYAFTPKISLGASVTNMFDQYYFSSVGGAVNTLGNPRKFLFTFRGAF